MDRRRSSRRRRGSRNKARSLGLSRGEIGASQLQPFYKYQWQHGVADFSDYYHPYLNGTNPMHKTDGFSKDFIFQFKEYTRESSFSLQKRFVKNLASYLNYQMNKFPDLKIAILVVPSSNKTKRNFRMEFVVKDARRRCRLLDALCRLRRVHSLPKSHEGYHDVQAMTDSLLYVGEEDLRDFCVVVVDDVVTTGSTFQSVSNVLNALPLPPKEIVNYALCRTCPHLDRTGVHQTPQDCHAMH